MLDINVEDRIKDYVSFVKNVDVDGLQENWTNKDRSKNSPIKLVDDIGEISNLLIAELKELDSVKRSKLAELTELILRKRKWRAR